MQEDVLAKWSISSLHLPATIRQWKLGSAYNSQLGATTTHSFSRNELIDHFAKTSSCIALQRNGIHDAIHGRGAGRRRRGGLLARVILLRFEDIGESA